MNNLSVKPRLFTDKLSILSQLFTVIRSVETYRLTDKLHFKSQWFQELVARAP